MADKSVGTIHAKVVASADGFNAGIDAAAAKANAFKDKIGSILSPTAFTPTAMLSGVAASLAIPASVGGFMAWLDTIKGKALETAGIASRLGATIKEATTIKAVGGDKTGELEQVMAHFNRRLGDLKMGSEDASKSFARLGLGVDDFKGKSVTESFTAYAAAVRKFGDASVQASINQEMLGKSAESVAGIIRRAPEDFKAWEHALSSTNAYMTETDVKSLKLQASLTKVIKELGSAADEKTAAQLGTKGEWFQAIPHYWEAIKLSDLFTGKGGFENVRDKATERYFAAVPIAKQRVAAQEEAAADASRHNEALDKIKEIMSAGEQAIGVWDRYEQKVIKIAEAFDAGKLRLLEVRKAEDDLAKDRDKQLTDLQHKVFAETRTPLERYESRLQDLDKAFPDGGDVASRAIAKAFKDLTSSMKDVSHFSTSPILGGTGEAAELISRMAATPQQAPTMQEVKDTLKLIADREATANELSRDIARAVRETKIAVAPLK